MADRGQDGGGGPPDPSLSEQRGATATGNHADCSVDAWRVADEVGGEVVLPRDQSAPVASETLMGFGLRGSNAPRRDI